MLISYLTHEWQAVESVFHLLEEKNYFLNWHVHYATHIENEIILNSGTL